MIGSTEMICTKFSEIAEVKVDPPAFQATESLPFDVPQYVFQPCPPPDIKMLSIYLGMLHAILTF
jgi:hypothetical protein